MKPAAAKPAFRANKDLLDDTTLDEATRRMLLQNLGRNKPPASSALPTATTTNRSDGVAEPTAATTAGEVTLDMAMLTRLNALEKHVSVLQKELKEKSVKLAKAEDRAADAEEQLERAETQKLILANRLAEMNRYLADYGLTFVGAAPTNAEAHKSSEAPSTFSLYDGDFNAAAAAAAATASTQQPAVAPPPEAAVPFDMELAKFQAEKLSCSIAHTTIETNGKTGIIKERDTVYVCVYKDGICVNSGIFRPYGWPLCDAFLTDLLDGYFPYEFKDRYPDGFPIEIVDKSSEVCPREAKSGGPRTVGDHGYKPLDRDQLLRRLPQQYVTASGKLVNVQSAVAEFIGGSEATSCAGPQSVSAATPAASGAAASTSTPISSIKVRFAAGHEVLLKMFYTDSIADLRREMIAASAPFFDSKRPFELCSVYPRRTYDQHNDTIAAAGLVPNATLQIKLIV